MNKLKVPEYLFFTVTVLFCLGIASGQDTVHIVQEAWHTGIVFKTNDVPADILPATEQPRAKYIDVSWGDEKYYQIAGKNMLLASRAVLFPTKAVIRLVSFDEEIRSRYNSGCHIQIILDSTEFFELCNFIAKSYARDEKGNIIPSTLYRKSNVFFLAKRKYHLFRTCNTWVALAFKKAGFDICTFLLITASQLFNRLREIPGATLLSKD